MVFLMLLAIVVGAALVIAVWPESPAESCAAAGKTTQTEAGKVAVGSAPESLEGVLVSQLGSGEINRRQYVHEMEKLAARDDERHPLVVPPDLGSAAA